MLNLTNDELVALVERHSETLDKAARLLLPRPISAGRDIDDERERFALIMYGALVALDVPPAEAQPLAIEATLIIFRNYLRLQHPAGNA